jgi:hypothetical protein
MLARGWHNLFISIMNKKLKLNLLFLLFLATSCHKKPAVLPSAGSDLVVFPNPARNETTITVRNQGINASTVKVFDTNGEIFIQESFRQSGGEVYVTLIGQPAGTYHVVLETVKGNFNQKFIKL